jgi:hypothetical protein
MLWVEMAMRGFKPALGHECYAAWRSWREAGGRPVL